MQDHKLFRHNFNSSNHPIIIDVKFRVLYHPQSIHGKCVYTLKCHFNQSNTMTTKDGDTITKERAGRKATQRDGGEKIPETTIHLFFQGCPAISIWILDWISWMDLDFLLINLVFRVDKFCIFWAGTGTRCRKLVVTLKVVTCIWSHAYDTSSEGFDSTLLVLH